MQLQYTSQPPNLQLFHCTHTQYNIGSWFNNKCDYFTALSHKCTKLHADSYIKTNVWESDADRGSLHDWVYSGRRQLGLDWLSCGFTSHSTQNRSFRRRFPKPISWPGMEKTKPNTIKEHIHKSKEMYYNTRTYTHPFNGPFSGTTRVSQYQKCKSNLDFTEARDSE